MPHAAESQRRVEHRVGRGVGARAAHIPFRHDILCVGVAEHRVHEHPQVRGLVVRIPAFHLTRQNHLLFIGEDQRGAVGNGGEIEVGCIEVDRYREIGYIRRNARARGGRVEGQDCTRDQCPGKAQTEREGIPVAGTVFDRHDELLGSVAGIQWINHHVKRPGRVGYRERYRAVVYHRYVVVFESGKIAVVDGEEKRVGSRRVEKGHHVIDNIGRRGGDGEGTRCRGSTDYFQRERSKHPLEPVGGPHVDLVAAQLIHGGGPAQLCTAYFHAGGPLQRINPYRIPVTIPQEYVLEKRGAGPNPCCIGETYPDPGSAVSVDDQVQSVGVSGVVHSTKGNGAFSA